MFSKTVLIAIFAAILCQLSQQKAVMSGKGSTDFEGCDDKYQCVGLPDGCLNKEEPDCSVLVKTEPLDDGVVEFNLIWDRPQNSSDNWVAAALSADKKMGDDSATVFIIDSNGKVNAEQGLTFVYKGKEKKSGVKPETVKGITVTKHKYANGKLTAKWNRDQKTTVEKLDFDLKKDKFYILLAYGPVVNGTIEHHSSAGMSAQALNLEEELHPNGTTAQPTQKPTVPSTVTQSGNSTTAEPTHQGNSTTAEPTHHGNSTVTHSGNTTETGSHSKKTTAHGTTPKPTDKPTHKPNSASSVTMGLFLTIFASILLILN